ncbi:hypothetical protein U1Q18_047325 [Sarracenia purpurea var. burkii]
MYSMANVPPFRKKSRANTLLPRLNGPPILQNEHSASVSAFLVGSPSSLRLPSHIRSVAAENVRPSQLDFSRKEATGPTVGPGTEIAAGSDYLALIYQSPASSLSSSTPLWSQLRDNGRF